MLIKRFVILISLLGLGMPVVCFSQSRDLLLAELNGTFSNFLENPIEYGKKVDQECRQFPDGLVFPHTAVALAWCHQIFENPSTAETKLRLIEKTLGLALDAASRQLGPGRGDLWNLSSVNQQGSSLSQLAMALSAYRLAGGKKDHLVASEKQLVRVLEKELLSKKGFPIDSYRDITWPTDTAIALFAITMHDRTEGSSRAVPLVKQHKRWLATRGIDPTTQLPASQVFTGGGLGPARGCDLSWRLSLWEEFDSAQSRQWYQTYRTNFWKKATVAQGFRESLSEAKMTPDLESGPILARIGGTATVLGLCACQAHGDRLATDQILKQASALSRARKSRDIVSRMMIKVMDGAITDMGIPTEQRYITGFLYGEAMAFYALSWHAYPARPIRQLQE